MLPHRSGMTASDCAGTPSALPGISEWFVPRDQGVSGGEGATRRRAGPSRICRHSGARPSGREPGIQIAEITALDTGTMLPHRPGMTASACAGTPSGLPGVSEWFGTRDRGVSGGEGATRRRAGPSRICRHSGARPSGREPGIQIAEITALDTGTMLPHRPGMTASACAGTPSGLPGVSEWFGTRDRGVSGGEGATRRRAGPSRICRHSGARPSGREPGIQIANATALDSGSDAAASSRNDGIGLCWDAIGPTRRQRVVRDSGSRDIRRRRRHPSAGWAKQDLPSFRGAAARP